MVIFTSLIAALAVFEVLALRYGADSRPFFDEQPERARRRTL